MDEQKGATGSDSCWSGENSDDVSGLVAVEVPARGRGGDNSKLIALEGEGFEPVAGDANASVDNEQHLDERSGRSESRRGLRPDWPVFDSEVAFVDEQGVAIERTWRHLSTAGV